MPTKKTKWSPNEKKIDNEVDRLKQRPLDPDINAEKDKYSMTRKPLHPDTNAKKNEVDSSKQRRLYPDVKALKENIEFSSFDGSPEKIPYSHSPGMPKKSNSPSSTDSMHDIPGSPKRRSGRHLQNQMNNIQNSENSDVDMETDNVVGINHLHNQIQEKSEISPDFKLKKHLSPKSDGCENSTDARRRRLIHPEIQPQRTEPSASTSNSSRSSPENSIYLILFCIILFICLLILSIYWIRNPGGTPDMNDCFNASTLVSSLKSKFKDQPPLTFRIIHSALRNVLEVQPKAPAIILLLATNGSETVCSEFARRLVDSLSVPKYTLKISGKDFRQANTNHAKMEIDKGISNTLKNDQLGSVLIDDLDQIPGQAAMILHKYYDHENAPFKKAVFVMTVNYNKAISDYSDTKVWDKAANDHLHSVWTDIGVDQVTPLLARLTVSVVVITA